MDTFLLKSKLKIPPNPYRVVRRVRLIEALEGNMPFSKLALISAPAGYGKTTLLTQWAHSSRNQVAWLSLDPEDNDLERFLRYLLLAWDQVQPGVSESSLGLLLSGLSPDRDAVLPAFINAASEAPEPVVFVLDDYHLIEEESIHQALTFLLDHLPASLHFVLACRGEPPLPVARYRAHGEMLELGAADLKFLPEETQAFLNDGMGLALTNEEMDPLQTGTEGWIAGLQLAALSLTQHRTKPGKPLVGGRHRFIADYLSEDVLAHLQDDIQSFLLQTSLLDRLCSSLVEAVTGNENGQRMLEALERQALFLMPLDDNREWFRYHRLFAGFLYEELKRRNPDDLPDLHQRAARWYLAHNLPEQAFQHAVESQSAELVTQIIDRYFIAKLMAGQIVVVKGWLESLPGEWAEQYPVIGLAQAGILMITGQFEACSRRLDEVEQLALTQSEHPGLHRGRVMSMRCNIACFQNDLSRAQAIADQALRIISEDDIDFRAGIYGSLGDTFRRNGRWQEAKSSYLKLLDFTETPAFRVQAVHVYGALADLDLRQGHLRKAAGYWNKALAALRPRESWGNVPLPLAGWVYIRMGEILYEWNELDEARDHLSRGLKRAELGGDVRSLIAGYLITARLKLAEGDLDAAETYLERARPHLENAQFPHWNSRFERFQLELWLAQDKLQTAVQWSDEMLQDEALKGRPESEFAQLAVARVLILKGDLPSLGRAQALVRSLIQKAETEGRSGILIEALALEALVHERRGDVSNELKSLEHALRLAEPEGYQRLFLDLGPAMARLLQEARSRELMPDYAERLLSAFGDALSSPFLAGGALPEPLTIREVEVLKLLAAGLSNREIAGELVISPETVKKHAGNIYGKLGVGSRTEAAARARELDLLD